MSFVKGDIVKLKTGGPEMTVKSVDSTGVHCVWFFNEEKGSAQSLTVTAGLLRKIDEEDKPRVG